MAKLTNGAFNALWLDYVLEDTENKSLMSTGGIIGLMHNRNALNMWFYHDMLLQSILWP